MSVFQKELRMVQAQYPDLGDGWSVQMSGWALDELAQSAGEVHERYQTLTNDDGLFPEAAMAQALGEAVHKVEAPKGYHFVRLVKTGQAPLLLLLKLDA